MHQLSLLSVSAQQLASPWPPTPSVAAAAPRGIKVEDRLRKLGAQEQRAPQHPQLYQVEEQETASGNRKHACMRCEAARKGA